MRVFQGNLKSKNLFFSSIVQKPTPHPLSFTNFSTIKYQRVKVGPGSHRSRRYRGCGCQDKVECILAMQQNNKKNHYVFNHKPILVCSTHAAFCRISITWVLHQAFHPICEHLSLVWGTNFFACEHTERRVDKGTIFLKLTFFNNFLHCFTVGGFGGVSPRKNSHE